MTTRADDLRQGLKLAAVAVASAVIAAAVGYAEGGLLSRELGAWQTISWALVVAAPVMLALTALFAAGGAVAGFWIAYYADAATSAGMAVFYGLTFVAVLTGTVLARKRRHRVGVSPATPDWNKVQNL